MMSLLTIILAFVGIWTLLVVLVHLCSPKRKALRRRERAFYAKQSLYCLTLEQQHSIVGEPNFYASRRKGGGRR